eukprot:10350949-Alexandrium_andersonii.AAC.1
MLTMRADDTSKKVARVFGHVHDFQCKGKDVRVACPTMAPKIQDNGRVARGRFEITIEKHTWFMPHPLNIEE